MKRTRESKTPEHEVKSKRHKQNKKDPAKRSYKVFKYATLGRVSKLKKLLDSSIDVNLKDAQGNTALHHASRFGQLETAVLLLDRGADPNIPDQNGNTPTHLAALHNHLPLVVVFLTRDTPPDVELANQAGQTVRQLAEQLMARVGEGQGSADSAPKAQGLDENSPDSNWHQRLAEEHSGGEDDHAAWEQYETGWASPGAAGLAVETDDQWADRIWQGMQRKRHAERFKGFADYEARLQEQRRREERKAEAAQASARILGAEQARDRAWREAAGGPAPQPALPQPPPADISPAAAAARYAALEAAWQALEQAPASQVIRYSSVPWVVQPGESGSVFAAVLLAGVEGPADVKARLRREIMRWHPDKFSARWGGRLAAADRERVLARVKEMSQHITQLMAGP